MNAKTRLPAEIFKLAVDLGRYRYLGGMCLALNDLRIEGVITGTEMLFATEEITRYMDRLKGGALYLRTALEYCGLPYDEEATTAIYLDWDNRPYKNDTEERRT